MRTHSRCPECGAIVPVDAQWCSLCLASRAPDETDVPTTLVAPGRTDDDATHAEEGPEVADSDLHDETDASVPADPDKWAALLAAHEASDRPSVVRAMSRPSVRVAVILLGTLGIAIVLTLLCAAVVLLTGK